MSSRRVKGTRVAPIAEFSESPLVDDEKPADQTRSTALGFRPIARPPMAHLVIIDDGLEEGETIRLRASETTIGRTDGDVLIPHDPLISAAHLEIKRQKSPDGYRWRLRDLGSTNGTFVRLLHFRVLRNYELILGTTRFRFCIPETTHTDGSEGRSESSTRGWAAVSRGALAVMAGPTLIQLDGDDEIASFSLGESQVIGSTAGNADLKIDDPLLEPSHARLYRMPNGKWYIEDQGSLNGVWIRIECSHTSRHCEFLLGEQRFVLKVL